MLSEKATQKIDSTKKELVQYSDSTCKCPPECCHLSIILKDSTGKCPPECPKITMLFSNTMEDLIYRVYKKNLIHRVYKNK